MEFFSFNLHYSKELSFDMIFGEMKPLLDHFPDTLFIAMNQDAIVVNATFVGPLEPKIH